MKKIEIYEPVFDNRLSLSAKGDVYNRENMMCTFKTTWYGLNSHVIVLLCFIVLLLDIK